MYGLQYVSYSIVTNLCFFLTIVYFYDTTKTLVNNFPCRRCTRHCCNVTDFCECGSRTSSVKYKHRVLELKVCYSVVDCLLKVVLLPRNAYDFLYTTPSVLPYGFHMALITNLCLIIAWLFLFDRE